MSLINSLASWLIKKRIHDIELFIKYPNEVQKDVLKRLVRHASGTHWGKLYGYSSIDNYETYRSRVPLQDYESLKQFIDRQRNGEPNIIWPTDIKWFAKSSGTTSDKSKFIPVSEESLKDCHYKGGKDMLAIYCNNYPETSLFTGKSLSLSGSKQLDNLENDIYSGDVSAIILSNLPFLAEFARTPSMETAMMTDWEKKIEKIAEETIIEDVTSLAGVPSWMFILLDYIVKKTGKSNIHEVWPNLEVYFHGGISIHPYKKRFESLLPKMNFNYMETYNASEGFFGIQDLTNDSSMLLMLDYGVFYEFLDIDNHHTEAIQLSDVKLGVVYSVIISTNAGLWRYQIGDTIQFTSTSPYRFIIAGRTKNFINSFGEELMVHNSDKAIEIACSKTGSQVAEYTAGPLFYEGGKGCHEWIIEFETAPSNLQEFGLELDTALKSLNSDYEAKRSKDLLLQVPKLTTASRNTFYNWLKTKNKLGGQYKVPRLSNNRSILEEIYTHIN